MSLRFVPGSGRLFKNDRYLAFFSEPSDELLELVSKPTAGDRDALFKALGSAVIKHDFQLAPFVVIALDGQRPRLFAFGDLDITSGEDQAPITSTSTVTWVERELSATESVTVAVNAVGVERVLAGFADCFLDDGCVPADTFVWHNTRTDDHLTADHPTADHLAAEEQVAGMAPALSMPVTNGRLSGTVVDSDATMSFSQGFFTTDVPSLINGRPGPIEPESGHGESPSSVHGRLLLDDGQSIDIEQSVYVGRFPSKHGLPPGYNAIVIASDYVSRIHWELVFDGDHVSVADLGSTTGTWIQGPDDAEATRLSAGHLVAIVPDTIITFGDRAARYSLD